MPSGPRPVPIVLAELAEVRRHLGEAPPHHGAGVRERLDQRLRALERELDRAHRDADDRDARRDAGDREAGRGGERGRPDGTAG